MSTTLKSNHRWSYIIYIWFFSSTSFILHLSVILSNLAAEVLTSGHVHTLLLLQNYFSPPFFGGFGIYLCAPLHVPKGSPLHLAQRQLCILLFLICLHLQNSTLTRRIWGNFVRCCICLVPYTLLEQNMCVNCLVEWIYEFSNTLGWTHFKILLNDGVFEDLFLDGLLAVIV